MPLPRRKAKAAYRPSQKKLESLESERYMKSKVSLSTLAISLALSERSPHPAVTACLRLLHAYRNSLKYAVYQPWKQHQNKVAKKVSFFQVWHTPVPDVVTVLVDVVVLLLFLKYLSINILPSANRL